MTVYAQWGFKMTQIEKINDLYLHDGFAIAEMNFVMRCVGGLIYTFQGKTDKISTQFVSYDEFNKFNDGSLKDPSAVDGISLDYIELTNRSMACLRSEGIYTIEQLKAFIKTNRKEKLLRIPNLGRKSLNEIMDCLDRFNNGDSYWHNLKEAGEI